MTLTITFPPQDDESGRGYYRRLASGNSLRGWRELAGMANVPRTAAALLICPEHVAAELDLEPTWASTASQQEQQARTWRGLRRMNTEAVCPACLEKAAYVRDFWEHGFVTACPTHRTNLIDRCPVCRDLISPNRQCIELCACGHDLRTVESTASTPAQHWLSSLIASRGESAGDVKPALGRVDIVALCELVRDMCRGYDPTSPPARKGAASVRTVQEAVEFLAPLGILLADWPAGFEGHVSTRIKAGKPSARTLNTLLGGWYGRLKKTCKNTPLEPFLQTVIEVASKEFDGVLSLDGAADIAAEFTQSLLVSEAAKALGVGWGFLHSAVTSGKCASTTRRMGKHNLVYQVPRSEVDRIALLRSEWIGEEEACAIAQVPPAAMRMMMEAGVVEADPKWRNDIFKGGAVQKQSLETLCTNLCGTSRAARHTEAGYVLWSDLTGRRMGDKHAIQSAMRAAASGELQPAFRGRHLGKTSFLKSELAMYFGRPVLESGMSVQQLAQRTGWKWESIGHWIDSGLLGAEQITLRGQPCRVVSPEQLFAFQQIYVPLADLAKALEKTSSYLADQLGGIEIIGAKPLPTGGRRGGLIRIADLARLALQASQSLRLASQ